MTSSTHLQKIAALLETLYGRERAEEYGAKLHVILDRYRTDPVIVRKRKTYGDALHLTEKDSVLITYANTITEDGEKPLQTLRKFLKKHIGDAVSTVHILPFFPFSSDGGFAVTDFRRVHPAFGDWSDIEAIGEDYRLMADFVFNHVSKESEWFQKFLKGDPKYANYFIAYDEKIDTSAVLHPREDPLLTKVETVNGPKYVWTTFSPDQMDLNYRCPDVLLEMIDVLLNLFSHGIDMIRLDALAYIWDDPSSLSVHLPQTHAILKIIRAVVDEVVPYGLLLSEAVFPFQENAQYLGTEHDESHMMTAFHLPPLVLDSYIHKDATELVDFLEKRALCSGCLFFNVLATHDGIPLPGVEDFLTKDHIEALTKIMESKGGYISYKQTDGNQLPYEMNITYFDAINDSDDNSYEAVERFIGAHAMLCSVKGMPAVYIGSFLANHNDIDHKKRTNLRRDINRSHYTWEYIEKELSKPGGRRTQCLEGICTILRLRKTCPQFEPQAHQTFLRLDPRLFAVERERDGKTITVIVNTSGESIPCSDVSGKAHLDTGTPFSGTVEPYEMLFLH